MKDRKNYHGVYFLYENCKKVFYLQRLRDNAIELPYEFKAYCTNGKVYIFGRILSHTVNLRRSSFRL